MKRSAEARDVCYGCKDGANGGRICVRLDGREFEMGGEYCLDGELCFPAARAEECQAPTPLRVPDLVALSFLALLVVLATRLLNAHLLSRLLPGAPTILIVTTLTLLLGQVGPVRRLHGAAELGTLTFYLFFCAVGAMIDLRSAVVLSPVLFAYVMVMIAVHMVTVCGVGQLLRLDIRLLTIAAAATKAGPPTVLALANAKAWPALALPGVALGLLGYAVGNYLGFVAAAVRALTGA